LIHITITSLKEEIRLKMEPRTATAKNRLHVIQTLSEAGIPVGVMIAPIIPGLTSDEIPATMSAAGQCGAGAVGKTIVRLNGAVGEIFHDWLYKNFPDAAEKVWHHICQCHGGQVNDNNFGRRMKGEGKIAESIDQLFRLSRRKFIKPHLFEYDLTKFKQYHGSQLSIFEES
jgi:DNA repair photolyase